MVSSHLIREWIWLAGLGFNGHLRQYFSLYRAYPKEREKEEMSKQPPPEPTASAVGPCPTLIQNVGRHGTGSLSSTIAPPDHPRYENGGNISILE